MGVICVTGSAGAGKSTLVKHLQALGHEAYGTDEDGFRSWRDKITGESVVVPDDWNNDRHFTSRAGYGLREDRVKDLVAKSIGRTTFLIGAVEPHVWHLMDMVVFLSADDETLRTRLMARTDNSYGKAPHEMASILIANQTAAKKAKGLGAVLIDACKEPGEVAEDVLDVVRRRRMTPPEEPTRSGSLAAALAGLTPVSEEQADWSDAIRPRIWCYLTDREMPLDLVGSVRAVVFHQDCLVTVTNLHEEYFIPGGKREAGESQEETVRREVLEESGWHLGPLRQFAVMHLYFDNEDLCGHSPHPHVLWPIFVAEAERFDQTSRLDDGYDVATHLRPIGEVETWSLCPRERHLLDAAKRARVAPWVHSTPAKAGPLAPHDFTNGAPA